jgi:hypothetical protein
MSPFPVSSHNLSLSTLIRCRIHTHSPSIYGVRLLMSKTFSSIGVDTESKRESMRWPRPSKNPWMSKVHGMLQGVPKPLLGFGRNFGHVTVANVSCFSP